MSREQYVLDYSNKEVRDHIYGMMKKSGGKNFKKIFLPS